MIRLIDNFLNKITMYRLALYELIFLFVAALGLNYLKILPYGPIYLIFSLVFIIGFSWSVNEFFAFAFDAPSNPESIYITALILVLIITPPTSWSDPHYLSLALWASAWAMASKYIIAIKRKHIFNPAALGVAITALTLNQSASWWVDSLPMLPFVIIGGLLLVRKLRHSDLFFAYLIGFVTSITYFEISKGLGLFDKVTQSLLYAPIFFFGTVMLTEPLTTPPTRYLRLLYGLFVGLLFAPEIHFGSFYFTPELALLSGNIFSYLVSPKEKILLQLKNKKQLSPDIYEFEFGTEHPVLYKPGQYMEWTLAHAWSDSRGARRYFTLSSSPTEPDLKLGVKFYAPPSSFKKSMLNMNTGDNVIASQLSGEFVLPNDKNKKLVFIAGGIGVTPFRSIIQYLLDMQEKRDIVLLYSNRKPVDAVYKDIFDRASQDLGVRTIYAFTDKGISPAELPPQSVQMIDGKTILQQIPDFKERIFYISGPHSMVNAFKDTLTQIGVKRRHIKIDYFPGFA